MKLEKELRIGNLIYGCYYNEDESDDELTTVCEVLSIDLTGDADHSIWVDSQANIEEFNNFLPIQLTEEWLLKFGFEKDEEYDNTFNRGISVLNGFTTITIDVRAEVLLLDCMEIKIKYVHQLQNLHFALTKEELTL